VFFLHKSEELKPKAKVAFPCFFLVHSNCDSNTLLITLWRVLTSSYCWLCQLPKWCFHHVLWTLVILRKRETSVLHAFCYCVCEWVAANVVYVD